MKTYITKTEIESNTSDSVKLLPIRQAVKRFVENTYNGQDWDSIDKDVLIEIPDVMLFNKGLYKIGSKDSPDGILTTLTDLQDMLSSANDLGLDHVPIVKITHKSKDKNKENKYLNNYPFSVGEVIPSTLRIENNISLGGSIKLFKWVCTAIIKGYLRGLSAEIKHNVKTQDNRFFPKLMDSIALLGNERPAQWETMKTYSDTKENTFIYENIYTFSEDLLEMEKEEEMNIEVDENQPKENEAVTEKDKMKAEIKEEIMEAIKEMLAEKMEAIKEMFAENKEEKKDKEEAKVDENKEDMKEENKENYSEEYQTLSTELIEAQKQINELKQDKIKTDLLAFKKENNLFVETLVKSKKILPAMKNKTLDILNNSNREKVVCYSENNEEVKLSQHDQMKNFLSSFSENIVYSENIAPNDLDNDIVVTDSDFTLYGTTDKQQIIEEKKATKKVEDYAKEKNISFSDAYSQLYN